MFRKIIPTIVLAALNLFVLSAQAQEKEELSKYDRILLDGAYAGDLEKVKEGLAGGTIRRAAKIDAVADEKYLMNGIRAYRVEDDFRGDTALNMAIRRGHTEVALYLISKGANVNYDNRRAGKPLQLAAEFDKTGKVVSALLDAKATGLEYDLSRPAKSAALSNNVKALEVFLMRGMNPTGAEFYPADREKLSQATKDLIANPPYLKTVEKFREFLKLNGIYALSMQTPANDYQTLLDKILRQGRVDLLKEAIFLLREQVVKEQTENFQGDPLQIRALSEIRSIYARALTLPSSQSCIDYLLNEHLIIKDIDARYVEYIGSTTPRTLFDSHLHLFSITDVRDAGFKSVMNAKWAPVDRRSGKIKSEIQHWIQYSNALNVNTALELGFDLQEALDDAGATAFDLAARIFLEKKSHESFEVLESLILKNAPNRTLTAEQSTDLILQVLILRASVSGESKEQLVDQLTARGFKLEFSDPSQSALHEFISVWKSRLVPVKDLKDYDAALEDSSRALAEKLGQLIKAGADPKRKNSDGQSVVESFLTFPYATAALGYCSNGQWCITDETFKSLVEAGLPADLKMSHGESLLSVYLMHSNFERADLLIARGASLNSATYEGEPVLFAFLSSSKFSEEEKLIFIQRLKDRHYDFSVKNTAGQTALEFVYDKPELQLVAALLFTEGLRFADDRKNLLFASKDEGFFKDEAFAIRKKMFIVTLEEAASLNEKQDIEIDPVTQKERTAWEAAIEYEIPAEKWKYVAFKLPSEGAASTGRQLLEKLKAQKAPEEAINRLTTQILQIEEEEKILGTLLATHFRSFQKKAERDSSKRLSASDALKVWNVFIERVGQSKPIEGNMVELKRAFEDALRFQNFGQAVKYSAEATSVFHPICEGRLQCYSATTLFHLTASSIWKDAYFEKAEPLTIFSEGHILPGFARKNDDGEYEIFGIESTADGPAEVPMGLAKDLDKQENPARILIAKDALEMEELKLKGNSDAAMKMLPAALERIKSKYGIPVEALEEKIKSLKTTACAPGLCPNLAETSSDLNRSPWAFGESKTPAGDQARAFIESLDGKLKGAPNAACRDSGFKSKVDSTPPVYTWQAALEIAASDGMLSLNLEEFMARVVDVMLKSNGLESYEDPKNNVSKTSEGWIFAIRKDSDAPVPVIESAKPIPNPHTQSFSLFRVDYLMQADVAEMIREAWESRR